MARTKLTNRNNFNKTRAIFRTIQALEAENRPRPRIRNKNIFNRRVRNRTIEIKRTLARVEKGPSEKNVRVVGK